jgi:hypothetical protein
MSRRRLSAGAFLALQVALLLGIAVWVASREHARQQARGLPPLRSEPLHIGPLYDEPAVVSDQELRRVLPRLVLRYQGMGTVIGHADHVLRLWGPSAVFADPQAMSGADLLALLTDHRRFAQVYGGDQPPLLIDVPGGGVRVRALEGPVSASHVDHLAASLAELGTPLSQPVWTPAGETTYRAIVEESLREFSLNQPEYEWSALLYDLFVPPASRWRTTEGQEVSFDLLAARIMRQRLPEGVCAANHRMHALVDMLRADDAMTAQGQPRILGAEERSRVIDYLRGVTALLVAHQHADGFWNFDWPFATPSSVEPTEQEGDRLGDRIIVTGHALEWWSLAPREVQPPLDTVVRAAGWVVRTVDGLSDDQIQPNVSFLSHAGRALAQWRGMQPVEVLKTPPE